MMILPFLDVRSSFDHAPDDGISPVTKVPIGDRVDAGRQHHDVGITIGA